MHKNSKYRDFYNIDIDDVNIVTLYFVLEM